jgi:hypothetical protein
MALPLPTLSILGLLTAFYSFTVTNFYNFLPILRLLTAFYGFTVTNFYNFLPILMALPLPN